jgi:hypothetical protein
LASPVLSIIPRAGRCRCNAPGVAARSDRDALQTMTERPYLILTLRRTGGTSFMSFLSAVSAFPSVQHEPFNPDRIWGAVTRDFRKSGNAAAMQAAVAACVTGRPNIKHCIEIMPAALTRALIEACAAQGYAFLLLTRRDEASRLRSLFLAEATGAWGPLQAAKVYPRIQAGEIVPGPVPAEDVPRRVAADAAALGQVLAVLRNRQIAPDWLVFEELYAPDGRVADRARAIAAGLGITVAADDDRLQVLAESQGQGSSAIEPFVPGFDRIRALLAELCIT